MPHQSNRITLPLTTARLILRPWQNDTQHFAGYCQVFCNEQVMAHVTNGAWNQEKATQRFRSLFVDRWDVASWCVWRKNRIVGCVEMGSNPTLDAWEIRWFYTPSTWGRGVATEVGQRVLQMAFEKLELPNIKALSHPDHHAAHRVLEKLGFTSAIIRFEDCHRMVWSLDLQNF